MMDNLVVNRLAQQLGDTNDPHNLFSFAQRVAEDDAQLYPAAAIQWLNDFGLSAYYVPQQLGGQLHSVHQLGELLRLVAQRDLTVAISHAITFLGSATVWIAGQPPQQQALASAILAGEMIAMGLTEQGSGSDLLNMETKAVWQDGNYQLTGDKWLVNGATHHRFAVIYAQTRQQRNARGYSLFLYDKQRYPDGLQPQSGIMMLGTRGADIGSMLLDATLDADTLIGQEGAGFEMILKALQLSRTLCGSLSLGVLDTALDTVLDFALSRPIYGKTVANLGQSQRLIGEAWAEYLISDSLNHVARRGLQAIPEQACIHSAVVKSFIPTLAEHSMQKLATVYGARYYLCEGHHAGIFQKMLRDNLLVSLFDGSTQVNLHSLSFQLSGIARQHQSGPLPEWIQLDATLNPIDFQKLALHSGGQDALFASLSSGISALRNRLSVLSSSAEILWVETTLEAIENAYQKILTDLMEIAPNQYISGDPWAFELARRYCILCACAAVLAQHQLNHTHLSHSLAVPATLALVLQRLASLLGHDIFLPAECYQTVFSCLLMRREIDGKYQLFS